MARWNSVDERIWVPPEPVLWRQVVRLPIVAVDGRIVSRSRLCVTRPSDRRFISFEPHLYVGRRSYLFTISDFETNLPIGIAHSSRLIGGFGYRFRKSSRDYLTAGIGFGRKHQRLSLDNRDDRVLDISRIGYIGLSFVTDLSKRVRFNIEVDSDFGAVKRVSELEFGLTWKLRDPLALKFKYETRMNGSLSGLMHPLDPDVESQALISLEIDVF